MKRPSLAQSSSPKPKKKAALNGGDGKDSKDFGKLFVPGKLTGKNRDDRLDFDPYDPSLSCEELFGSLDGGPLVDAVVEFYKDEELTVPWFTKDAKGVEHRSVVRSSHSRELQEDTVTAYKHRILTEGLSQRVAGRKQQTNRSGNTHSYNCNVLSIVYLTMFPGSVSVTVLRSVLF